MKSRRVVIRGCSSSVRFAVAVHVEPTTILLSPVVVHLSIVYVHDTGRRARRPAPARRPSASETIVERTRKRCRLPPPACDRTWRRPGDPCARVSSFHSPPGPSLARRARQTPWRTPPPPSSSEPWRPHDHGRSGCGPRGRRVGPADLLCRRCDGRRVEDRERRDHLHARFPGRGDRVRRGRDCRAVQPERGLGGDRRTQQPGRVRRGATGSTGPPTPGGRGRTWGWRTRITSRASRCIRGIRTWPMWRRSVTSGARTRSAASTGRPTAATLGTRSSTSTTTPARPSW